MSKQIQLVYLYIENSYSVLSNAEIQMGLRYNIRFINKKGSKDSYEETYYFSTYAKPDYSKCEDKFFDVQGRLKRIDIFVGKNGTGKTTLLNTLAGYGILGKWIEIYYSYEEQKYYYYASSNAYVHIHTYVPEVSIYLDNKLIEQINSKSRHVYLQTNDYIPEFVWKPDNDNRYNKMLMKSNFSSNGRFLFDAGNNLFENLNQLFFRLDFGVLAKKDNISNAIKQKQEIIKHIKGGDVKLALDLFMEMQDETLNVLKSLDSFSAVVPYKTSMESIISDFYRSIQRLKEIMCYMANKGIVISTNMTTETSYASTVVSSTPDTINEIMISFDVKINIKQKEDFEEFFNQVDEVEARNKIDNYSLVLFNSGFSEMSTGELAYLNLYSNIYNSLLSSAYSDGIVLLLLDEPETYMHPEWSRQLINRIVELINKLYDEHKEWKSTCQVIITTHTPYLLSDLLPNFVHRIERNSIYSGANCFASNLYDILDSNFFVSNPIGDYALNKLNAVLKETDIKNNEEAIALVDAIKDAYLKTMIKRKLGIL